MTQIFWWFAHRFIPKYIHHKPKCTLVPGYYDPDVRIINTVFEEVCKYVDTMEDQGLGDWTLSADHEQAWKAFTDARKWWKELRVNMQEEIESLWATNYSYYHEVAYQREGQLMELDKKHLKEVIDNIGFMWYP